MATCSSTRRRDPEVIVFHEPAWSLDKAKRRRKTKDGKRDDDDTTVRSIYTPSNTSSSFFLILSFLLLLLLLLSQGQVTKAKKAKLEERKKKIENEGVDFKQTMSEVQLLGKYNLHTIKYELCIPPSLCLVSSSLEGKKKRKFEDQMIRSLGGKGRKPDKMPYPLYQEVLKRRREKEKREKDMVQRRNHICTTTGLVF